MHDKPGSVFGVNLDQPNKKVHISNIISVHTMRVRYSHFMIMATFMVYTVHGILYIPYMVFLYIPYMVFCIYRTWYSVYTVHGILYYLQM